MRQTLQLLWDSQHPERLAITELALRGLDPHSIACVATSLRASAMEDAPSRVVDLVETQDQELGSVLRATIASHKRELPLMEARKQTTNPDHRMLLALVLNLPDRASIDKLVGQLIPHVEPADWLWSILKSMGRAEGLPLAAAHVLGGRLNDVSEAALRMLVLGHPLDHVSVTVAEHADLVADARDLCKALSSLPVVAPLLSPAS